MPATGSTLRPWALVPALVGVQALRALSAFLTQLFGLTGVPWSRVIQPSGLLICFLAASWIIRSVTIPLPDPAPRRYSRIALSAVAFVLGSEVSALALTRAVNSNMIPPAWAVVALLLWTAAFCSRLALGVQIQTAWISKPLSD